MSHPILKQTFPPFRTPYLFHLYFSWPCFVKMWVISLFFSVFVNCFKLKSLWVLRNNINTTRKQTNPDCGGFSRQLTLFFPKSQCGKCKGGVLDLTNGGRGNITNAEVVCDWILAQKNTSAIKIIFEECWTNFEYDMCNR